MQLLFNYINFQKQYFVNKLFLMVWFGWTLVDLNNLLEVYLEDNLGFEYCLNFTIDFLGAWFGFCFEFPSRSKFGELIRNEWMFLFPFYIIPKAHITTPYHRELLFSVLSFIRIHGLRIDTLNEYLEDPLVEVCGVVSRGCMVWWHPGDDVKSPLTFPFSISPLILFSLFLSILLPLSLQ